MVSTTDITQLKETFITRKECGDTVTALHSEINEQDVILAKVETRLKTIVWVMSVVAVEIMAVLGTVVAAFILR